MRHNLPIFLTVPATFDEIKLLDFLQVQGIATVKIQKTGKYNLKIYGYSPLQGELVRMGCKAYIAGFSAGYSA